MNKEIRNYELNRRQGNESTCLDPLTRLIRIEERVEFYNRCSKFLTKNELNRVFIYFGFLSSFKNRNYYKPAKRTFQKLRRIISPIKIDVLRKERLNTFNDA